MNLRLLKKTACAALVELGVERAFRHINRSKLLVVMYHGITKDQYDPPFWTQLPAEVFRQQLGWLRSNYHMVSQGEVIRALRGEGALPERAALVTFDDGLRNNYTVAFPLLQEMGIPAVVFLTVDLIGTGSILWFDELYLLLRAAMAAGESVVMPDGRRFSGTSTQAVAEAYPLCANALKRVGERARNRWLDQLRGKHAVDREAWLGDFGLLAWDQVLEMDRSGLIDFGVHTATHRILSELHPHEWKKEIVAAKATLEEKLGRKMTSFCFPNGRPGLDFRPEHVSYLGESGFDCAFTTHNTLFSPRGSAPFLIGRVPAGNDDTSLPDLFRLNASGFLHFTRAVASRLWQQQPSKG